MEDLRTKVIVAYRKAFNQGTDAAWNTYRKKLRKLAKEVNAISPEALEDWAFNTSYRKEN